MGGHTCGYYVSIIQNVPIFSNENILILVVKELRGFCLKKITYMLLENCQINLRGATIKKNGSSRI